jgi:photosystem II stability/assembly factor-like uncharacterized protein
MLKHSLSVAFLVICHFTFSQQYLTAEPVPNNDQPEWASLMYESHTNIYHIDHLYRSFYKSNIYVKNTHTQYYKRWRRSIDRYINDEGYLDSALIVRMAQKMDTYQQNEQNTQTKIAGNWYTIGPFEERKNGGALSHRQANIRSIAMCQSFPNIMYSGTEPGEIYKSIDGGDNWTNISSSIVTAYTTGAVTSNASIEGIAVDFTNPDKVYAVSGNEIFISSDGGLTWASNVFANAPLFGYIETPNEIQIDPSNSNRILIAGLDGLHESLDGGLTWTQVFTETCFDLKFQSGNANTIFVLRDNPITDIHEFVRSTDGGTNWTVMTNGWYNSTDSNRDIIGGRIAVSPANPSIIYAFLIGNSKAGDEGFIGLYKSIDGGDSWLNTQGFDGGPYTAAHPNLIASNPLGGFNQGMYNCALMISNTDADQVLVGGINLWKTVDAGLTFESIVDYYIPGLFDMHVDMQDFRSQGNEYWVTSDGGIFKSTDFFSTQPDFKMTGLHAADFWGFASGWNFDLLAGGTFHNGFDVYAESYPNGEFFSVSAGEPASGYVSPGDSTRVFWTDNSTEVPTLVTGVTSNFSNLGLAPNESPWFAESSEFLFHPNCYNHIYTGNENNILKSEDGGSNFNTIFSGPANSQVLDLEISRANSQIMYAVVVNSTFTDASVYTTNDQWQTSTSLSLPGGGGSLILIELDAEDENILWLSYPRGVNGTKVFKSLDAGQTWTNETSSELDDQRIYAMAAIGGTDGGVYINTNMTCYYKNNSMASWAIDNLGLPLTITTREILPFYRDGKVRIGSYGKGVWESQMYEAPTRPVAQIMVNQLNANCTSDLFYFDDYSMLNHSGASWLWSFENGSIATSTLRNPAVSFTIYGSHLVTLTITNNNGVSSTDSMYVTTSPPQNILSEDFEGNFPPNGWKINLAAPWIKTTVAGGYGTSQSSMLFDNYVLNQDGIAFNIETAIDLTNAVSSNCFLSFDVAYAKYAVNYADSLEVLVSSDCGSNWNSVYYKGGDDLATAPDETGAAFEPAANEWRTDSIDLGAYAGETNLAIRFSNINDFGQRLYIDNVNLEYTSNLSLNENNPSAIEYYPNPVSPTGLLTLKNGADGSGIISFALYDNNGKLMGSTKLLSGESVPLGGWKLSSGTYIISIQNDRQVTHSTLIVTGKK